MHSKVTLKCWLYKLHMSINREYPGLHIIIGIKIFFKRIEWKRFIIRELFWLSLEQLNKVTCKLCHLRLSKDFVIWLCQWPEISVSTDTTAPWKCFVLSSRVTFSLALAAHQHKYNLIHCLWIATDMYGGIYIFLKFSSSMSQENLVLELLYWKPRKKSYGAVGPWRNYCPQIGCLQSSTEWNASRQRAPELTNNLRSHLFGLCIITEKG